MQTDLSWDDLILFTHVARTGTLTAAAASAKSSPATLSRRMKALEARIGRRLFLHGAQGYALTADGRALLDRATRMEAAATAIQHWRDTQAGPICVRISAGTWTSRLLAHQVADYWTADASWVPEFLQANTDMDLERREIDIGIRNRRPDHPWLAGQRTGHVDFAVYAATPDITGWIGPAQEATRLPSARWIRDNHGDRIVTKANDPNLGLAMARAGIGRVVLPLFVGEADTDLIRLSDPIPDLRSEEWLVSHQDARHDPPIRAALDAIATFLRNSRRGIGGAMS